ncbi:MAG: hypothetical protein ACYDHH_18340 [Solirubrobacteraceae bacterium]
MKTSRLLAGAGAATALALAPVAIVAMSQTAAAANSPTFRDCAFGGGLDPDFVELSGVSPGAQGLSVAAGTSSVGILASESSDPGDNLGHDALMVTVTAPGAAPQTVSGMGTGHVSLTVPLASTAAGAVNTIGWTATFDNGFHHCPSNATPQNSKAMPFVVTVAQSGGPTVTPLTLTGARESHRSWRELGSPPPRHGHKAPIGTVFSYTLSHAATVKLSFVRGSIVSSTRTLTVTGHAGINHFSFAGQLSPSKRLAPGRYNVTLQAVDSSGTRSAPVVLAFTIVS